jgi:hypothetical protein
MLLRMARHHFLRGPPADVVGAARRRMARVDAKKIAPRRQHVGMRRRRAGRTDLQTLPFRRRQFARLARQGGGQRIDRTDDGVAIENATVAD